MIARRIQRAIVGALTGYRRTDLQIPAMNYNPLANALVHMGKDGLFPGAWTPDHSLTTEKVYAEKPPDNLRKHPFVSIHNSLHPMAEHTGDVTVFDSHGMNPERYPGHTCWHGRWVIYAEDNAGTSARAEMIRELIDAAMEEAIGRNALDFSIQGDDEVGVLPKPPILRLLCFRRIGLTQPYDEWYDGRRYWWRGIEYDVMLEEAPPVHSSER